MRKGTYIIDINSGQKEVSKFVMEDVDDPLTTLEPDDTVRPS